MKRKPLSDKQLVTQLDRALFDPAREYAALVYGSPNVRVARIIEDIDDDSLWVRAAVRVPREQLTKGRLEP